MRLLKVTLVKATEIFRSPESELSGGRQTLMANESQSFERPGVPVCSACGMRPGAVSAMVATPNGPTNVMLCQRCARELMQTGSLPQGQAPGGAAAHGQEPENTSKTPALDEFGRDLTAEARAGR